MFPEMWQALFLGKVHLGEESLKTYRPLTWVKLASYSIVPSNLDELRPLFEAVYPGPA